jgi:hypothetical protein
MNGDGNLDIALAGQFLKVKFGQGDGTFPNTRGMSAFDNIYDVKSVLFSDLNGDGALDLWVIGEEATTPLLLGNGDGTILAQQRFAVVANTWVSGDVNNNGRLDLVGISGNTVMVLLNRGNNR